MKNNKNKTIQINSEGSKEFSGPPDLNVSSKEVTRRNFLKATGFSMAALLTACSRAPVEKAIPYLIQPEVVIPGKAYWYASTSNSCLAGCNIMVKNRDGRPIKVEGNPEHPVTQGGVCPVCQAGILGLYDSKRLVDPQIKGKKRSWDELDKKIIVDVNKAKKNGKDIVFLTKTINSPSVRFYLDEFLKQNKNSYHFEYDPISYSAILDAHKVNYGKRILPNYKFDKADLILSFGSDFLGSWISPVQFTKDYRKKRNVSDSKISKHIQIESRMTITGAKADERIILDPVEIKDIISETYLALSKKSKNKLANELAEKLRNNIGKSLVISGFNDLDVQVNINRINQYLNNIGETIDLKDPSYQFNGKDNMDELFTKLKNNKVGILFFYNTDPVYELPEGKKFAKLMNKADATVSFSSKLDETTANCSYICPEPHYLESWLDNEFHSGMISMTQPAIRPIGNNRSFLNSLAVWTGKKDNDLQLIKNYWQTVYELRKKDNKTFNRWWDLMVHNGFSVLNSGKNKFDAFEIGEDQRTDRIKKDICLIAYPSVQLLDGKNSDNPWLQELADPITKITWDNFASVSFDKAEELGLKKGDVIKISTVDRSIELPVHIQIGQHDNVVAVALGYGRKGTERFHDTGPKWIERRTFQPEGSFVGQNVSPLLGRTNGMMNYSGIAIKIEKTSKSMQLAYTQTYDSLRNPENTKPPAMEVRPFVQETEFLKYKKKPSSGSHPQHRLKNLWKEDHPYIEHHWAMAIDLSACTGCSACVVSCQAENNIPVVGKDEVLRRREMHWLRIDRYYSGEGNDTDVNFQPMFCQHCDNAPCEPVCPVLATVHSSEGLSQQVYNRCIGTRFCANNCPYKVRRFNWFDYAKENNIENMVLNPDVTVRSRGVMEKCSMCVQRIQEGKLKAKAEGIKLKDGEIKLACEQSCPADAIVFGDLNDPESRISQLSKDPRHYHVLEELNVRPTVGYLTNIRNRKRTNVDKGEKKHG